MLKLTRPDIELKTQISLSSGVNVLSRLEINFLQKYFRHNLHDFFPTMLVNMYEGVMTKKEVQKSESNVCRRMFKVKQDLPMASVEGKIEKFYREKSRSIKQGQLPHAFKFMYTSQGDLETVIKQGELVYVDVVIKADVQKLQQCPQKILKHLAPFRQAKKKPSSFESLLQDSKHEFFNIFIIYFGDNNFSYFSKKNYDHPAIIIQNKEYKLRTTVFYISKQALIETFHTIHNLPPYEPINDIMIQFYQLKREKNLHRKRKQKIQQLQSADQRKKEIILTTVGVISAIVGIGLLAKLIISR